MKNQEAALLLPFALPGPHESDDPRIAKALRLAATDPSLREQLTRQRAFDERCLAALDAVPLPPALVQKIATAPPPARAHFSGRNALRQPVILAILIGGLVMLGWGGYAFWNREHSFPGKDDVMRMVESNDEMSETSMEPKAGKVGALDDWFFSKYGFEDFYVPPAFSGYTSVLARLFKQDGMPVAQVAVEDHGMVFYSFKAEDFGVQIQPVDSWRIFEDGEWAAAVQQHEDECFMVALKGSKSDLEGVLKNLPTPQTP